MAVSGNLLLLVPNEVEQQEFVKSGEAAREQMGKVEVVIRKVEGKVRDARWLISNKPRCRMRETRLTGWLAEGIPSTRQSLRDTLISRLV